MTYGEGSPHYWRHRVQNEYVKRKEWQNPALGHVDPSRDSDPMIAFILFSEAHLDFCIVMDDYNSAHELTGEPWPEGLKDRVTKARNLMEKLAEEFVRASEKARGM
jgi:hypothetical protein